MTNPEPQRQLTIRLDPEVDDLLRAIAEESGQSINASVNEFLRRFMARYRAPRPEPAPKRRTNGQPLPE